MGGITARLAQKSGLITPGAITAVGMALGAQLHTMHVEALNAMHQTQIAIEKNTDQIRELRNDIKRVGIGAVGWVGVSEYRE